MGTFEGLTLVYGYAVYATVWGGTATVSIVGCVPSFSKYSHLSLEWGGQSSVNLQFSLHFTF